MPPCYNPPRYPWNLKGGFSVATALNIAQIIVSIALIALILLQA
ncbi:MAG: preprotein translocase subunit SecG, partial [Chloroflexi bacterium]